MSTINDDRREPGSEIEELLPWYASGAIAPQERARVEQALDRDPVLQQALRRVREEQVAVVELAEREPRPSPRTLDRLMAGIANEPLRRAPARSAGGLVERLAAWVSGLGPQTLAYAGMAAALVILLQGAVLTGMLVGAGSTYETASGERRPGQTDGQGTAASVGTFALVGFAPEANAGQIAAFLERRGAAIVDGPRPGGLFRVRIGAPDLPADRVQALLGEWRAERAIIRLILPAAAN